MNSTPQEIRIATVSISFTDKDMEYAVAKSVVTIVGAVITVDGMVHKFSFSNGKICFTKQKKADPVFSKTVYQNLELLLETYACGVMKLNTITYRFDNDDCSDNIVAELEEEC